MIRRYLLLLVMLASVQIGFSAAPTFIDNAISGLLNEFEGEEEIDTPDTRYLTQVFSNTTTMPNVVYGNNVGVITGAPVPEDLVMDIYMPEGDTATNRPVWLVLHTGTFIPKFFNGSREGSRTDSVVVEVSKRLAKMGYVAVAASYRAGWNILSPDSDILKGTLLQAAYRGIQDVRTCIRYMRKTVAEDGNPYGIDPDKVGAFGIGTGGYLSLGAAGLDDPSEVALEKFLNSQTLLPLADTVLLGNPDGTSVGAINIPNHVGYSSDFDVQVNLGGAIGDASWIDGKENEPAIIGFHATGDIFAPYGIENVFEPVLNRVVISEAAGVRIIAENANSLGNNDVLDNIPAECDPLADLMAAQNDEEHTTIITPQTLPLGTDNFYAFKTAFADGSPWNWWGLDDLRLVIAGTNAVAGTEFNADSLHASGLLTNPMMSSERGNTYLDTVFMIMAPRAYYALGLNEPTTSVPLLTEAEVQLQVSPVPSNGRIELRSTLATPMQGLRVLDLNGAVIMQRNRINTDYIALDHSAVPPGIYILDVYFKTGRVAKKVVFK